MTEQCPSAECDLLGLCSCLVPCTKTLTVHSCFAKSNFNSQKLEDDVAPDRALGATRRVTVRFVLCAAPEKLFLDGVNEKILECMRWPVFQSSC